MRSPDNIAIVDEVKEIHDRMRAIEIYAKQAMNTDAERKATDIRIRAEAANRAIFIEGIAKDARNRKAIKDSPRNGSAKSWTMPKPPPATE